MLECRLACVTLALFVPLAGAIRSEGAGVRQPFVEEVSLSDLPESQQQLINAVLSAFTNNTEARIAFLKRIAPQLERFRQTESSKLVKMLDAANVTEEAKRQAALELIQLASAGDTEALESGLSHVVILPPEGDLALAGQAAEVILEASNRAASVAVILRQHHLKGEQRDRAARKLIHMRDHDALEDLLKDVSLGADIRSEAAEVLLDEGQHLSVLASTRIAEQVDLTQSVRDMAVKHALSNIGTGSDCWFICRLLSVPFTNGTNDAIASAVLETPECQKYAHFVIESVLVSAGIAVTAAEIILDHGSDAYGMALVVKRFTPTSDSNDSNVCNDCNVEEHSSLLERGVQGLVTMARSASEGETGKIQYLGTLAWGLREALWISTRRGLDKIWDLASQGFVMLGDGVLRRCLAGSCENLLNWGDLGVFEGLSMVAGRLTAVAAEDPNSLSLRAFKLLEQLPTQPCLKEFDWVIAGDVVRQVLSALPKDLAPFIKRAEAVLDSHGSTKLKNAYAIGKLFEAMREHDELLQAKARAATTRPPT